jgi:hypothetical protein
VTFTVFNGAVQIGGPATSGTVSGGAASATYVLPGGTGQGTYSIHASYSGGGAFLASNDNTHTLSVGLGSTTTVAANATAPFSASNQTVALSATVSSTTTVSEGTVTFTVKNGPTTIGSPVTSGTVAAGVASANFTLPGGTAAGTYTIQAVYNPGSDFTGSSDNTHSLTVTSNAAPTVVSYSVGFGSQSYNLTANALGRARLPWQISSITVVFSAAITTANQNSLTGVTTTGFSGLGTNTLTWTISPIAQGNFNTVLAGTGPNAIKDGNGTALNGGTDASQLVRVLWGDVNDDGVVNSSDLTLTNNSRVQPYNAIYDLSGDGAVDATDVTICRSRLNTTNP